MAGQPPSRQQSSGQGRPSCNTKCGESFLSSVGTLCASSIGVGVLSLPWAFKQSGLLGGALASIFVAAVSGYSMYVLAQHSAMYRAASLQELVERAFGSRASLALSLLLWTNLFGGNASCLIALADTGQPLLHWLMPHHRGAWWAGRNAVLIAGSLPTMLPLCFVTNLRALSGLGVVVAPSVVCLGAVLLLRGGQAAAHGALGDVALFDVSPSALVAAPLLLFAFQSHVVVATVQHELTPSGASRRARREEQLDAMQGTGLLLPAGEVGSKSKLRRMGWAIVVAYSITCCFYLAVGMAGYVAVPDMLHSNILRNFPRGDPLMQGARIAVMAIVIASYAVNHHPARQAAEQVLGMAAAGVGAAAGGDDGGDMKLRGRWLVLEATVFYLGTLGVAAKVEEVGSVYVVVGGLAGGVLLFLLPGSLLLWRPPSAGWSRGGSNTHDEEGEPEQRPLLENGGADRHRAPAPAEEGRLASAVRRVAGWSLMVLGAATIAVSVYSIIW